MIALPKSLDLFRGKPFHEFGIDGVEFSFDERRPIVIVTLGHYNIPDAIELSFGGVIYHAMMSESFVYMHDEDAWSQELFLAEAKTSQLVQHLARYTQVEGMMGDLTGLRHFRVIAQNFFVEIVAKDVPAIEVKNDA